VSAICEECDAQSAAKSQEGTKEEEEEEEEESLVLSCGDASLPPAISITAEGVEVCEYFVFMMLVSDSMNKRRKLGSSCMVHGAWDCYRLGENPKVRRVLQSNFSIFFFMN
jgi:hypothetical protein